jgi:hypothetical protein
MNNWKKIEYSITTKLETTIKSPMNLKGTSPIFFKGLLIIKSHNKNLELKMTCVKLSIPLCTD